MTDLTRRRFVSLLGALPVVGPALLAVGSKAKAAECTVHMGVLTVPPGATYTTPMMPLGSPKWHSFGHVVTVQIDPSAPGGIGRAVDSYWEKNGERLDV